MPSLRSVKVGVLLLLSAAPLAAQTAPKRPLRVEDFARVRNVRDAQLSPDGQWVAYAVGTTDLAKDDTDTDLWMVSWDGQQQIQLTSSSESESTPRWSPDGRWLAFLSSRQGSDDSQLWLLDRRGGEAVRLTEVKGGIDDYAWSPDAKRLVLVVTDPAPVDSVGGKPRPQPIVIDRYTFKDDGSGYLGNRRSHLYLFDVASKRLDTLTAGRFDDEGPVWSPDGRSIAFVSERTEGDPDREHNTDVFVMEANPGAQPRRLTTWAGPDDGPLSWSPDGKRIAYLQGSETRFSAYNQDVVAVVPVAGGSPRLLTRELDRDAWRPTWSRDGKWIYFMVTDDRARYLARVRPGGGEVEKIVPGKRVLNGFTVAPDGKIAVTLTTVDRPTEVFALDGSDYRRLSHQNDAWLAEVALAPAEGVEYTTPDGNEVHAMLYRPAGSAAAGRLPTLLRIHGGPNSQNGYEFDFERQLFAANGYAVLSPNYRGSAGRGRAWKEAIYADWGHHEVTDLLAGMDYLVKTGVADPQRLGIGGWSYGCILTDYSIATDPDRFGAATCGAGSAMQIAMYGVDEYVVQYDHELGPPWKNPDLWIKLSYPFFHADRIRTPTLFLGGDKDFNVPLIGGEQMYQALRTLGIPTELIIYPGQHHGISRPSFVRDRYQRYLDWYAKYLTGSAAAVTR